jgi:hypothetical protein
MKANIARSILLSSVVLFACESPVDEQEDEMTESTSDALEVINAAGCTARDNNKRDVYKVQAWFNPKAKKVKTALLMRVLGKSDKLHNNAEVRIFRPGSGTSNDDTFITRDFESSTNEKSALLNAQLTLKDEAKRHNDPDAPKAGSGAIVKVEFAFDTPGDDEKCTIWLKL